jgi:hypothetical protein
MFTGIYTLRLSYFKKILFTSSIFLKKKGKLVSRLRIQIKENSIYYYIQLGTWLIHPQH